ncbi:hypothetical protein [Shewanella sp.]|uniref:hypothetical protein n=1 Tax=Shewanella sp. TaxID=50422 RepID=UPI001EB4051C|nr:hypothetical protein [Shewanella sp.]NRB24450.1 hypothetical protein [Shewanella sp.]
MDLKRMLLIATIVPITLAGCGTYDPMVWDHYNEKSDNLGLITTVNNYDRSTRRGSYSRTGIESITDESGKKLEVSLFAKYVLAPPGRYVVTYSWDQKCKSSKCETEYYSEIVFLKAKRCHITRSFYRPLIRYREQSSMLCEDTFVNNGDGTYTRGKQVCKPMYSTRTKQGPFSIKADEYELANDNETCLLNKVLSTTVSNKIN